MTGFAPSPRDDGGRVVGPLRRLVLLSVVLGVVLAHDVLGQERAARSGLEIQLNRSRAAYDDSGFTYDPLWSTGFSIGYSRERPLSATVLATIGIRYLRLQDKYDVSGEYGVPPVNRSGYSGIQYRYISCPIGLRVFLDSRSGLFCEAGPEIGYLLSAKQVTEITVVGVSEGSAAIGITDDMNRLNFSVFLGMGVDLSDRIAPLCLRLRYAHGLTDVIKADDLFYRRSLREASIGLSYMF